MFLILSIWSEKLWMETVTEGKTTGEWYAWIVISILIILLHIVFSEINLKMNMLSQI